MKILVLLLRKAWPYLSIVLLGLIVWFLIDTISDLKHSLSLAKQDLIELTKENSDVKFTKGELRKFLDEAQSSEAFLIDSISRLHNIKTNEIKETQINYYTYVDTNFVDSVVPVYKEVRILADSSFVKPFSFTTDCYTLNGALATRDSSSLVEFTRVEFKDTILHIKYAKHPKWYQFWNWFKKPKVERIVVGDCGNVVFKNFSEED